jgi:penicillin-binding protein 2
MDFFERDHAWFASYAPSENPEIAVVVINEHGGHGGSDAAPAAMAVIEEYFRLKTAEEAARNGVPPPVDPEPTRPSSPPPAAPASPPKAETGTPREAMRRMEQLPWI